MDFFYQRRSLNTTVTVNKSNLDGHQFCDKIQVANDVLVALAITQSNRLAFSITPEARPSSGPLKHLESAVCWATIDDETVRIESIPVLLC